MAARTPQLAAALLAALLLLLPGCANPWAEHYQSSPATTAAAPLSPDAELHLEQVPFYTAMTVTERDGLRLLGRSSFFDSRAHSERRAVDFARTIGATTVLWGRTDPITSTQTVTTRMPVTERTRTTGRITTPDGADHDVDLRSTTSRWEDVTHEVTRTRHGHAAAFFAPAP